jgi:hypothetical protein
MRFLVNDAHVGESDVSPADRDLIRQCEAEAFGDSVSRDSVPLVGVSPWSIGKGQQTTRTAPSFWCSRPEKN